mmetsp:Transcript_28525/g.24401  ORF Transcript_28525/g.24401 Transcript_28525/m.24401 type:complete len:111 (-) Transcript_28525:2-334(-)
MRLANSIAICGPSMCMDHGRTSVHNIGSAEVDPFLCLAGGIGASLHGIFYYSAYAVKQPLKVAVSRSAWLQGLQGVAPVDSDPAPARNIEHVILNAGDWVVCFWISFVFS